MGNKWKDGRDFASLSGHSPQHLSRRALALARILRELEHGKGGSGRYHHIGSSQRSLVLKSKGEKGILAIFQDTEGTFHFHVFSDPRASRKQCLKEIKDEVEAWDRTISVKFRGFDHEEIPDQPEIEDEETNVENEETVEGLEQDSPVDEDSELRQEGGIVAELTQPNGDFSDKDFSAVQEPGPAEREPVPLLTIDPAWWNDKKKLVYHTLEEVVVENSDDRIVEFANAHGKFYNLYSLLVDKLGRANSTYSPTVRAMKDVGILSLDEEDPSVWIFKFVESVPGEAPVILTRPVPADFEEFMDRMILSLGKERNMLVEFFNAKVAFVKERFADVLQDEDLKHLNSLKFNC